MSTTQTERGVCPYCGHKVDAQTNTSGDRRPRPGCPSLCVYCGGVCVLDAQLRLRRPTAAERLRIEVEHGPKIEAAQRYIRERNRRKGDGR